MYVCTIRMYVCMYVCMYVYASIKAVYAYMYVWPFYAQDLRLCMYVCMYVCEIPDVCLYSEQSACPMYEVFQLCTTPITTWQGVFSWQPQTPEAKNPNLALLVLWLSTDPKHWCLPSLCRRMSIKDQVEFSSCVAFPTGIDKCCCVCMNECMYT